MVAVSPHAHDWTPPSTDQDRCPWCDQPISHEKFQDIKERIQKEEEQKLAALQSQFKADFEAAKRAEMARAETTIAEAKKALEVRAAEIKEEAQLPLREQLEKSQQLAEQRQAEAAAAAKRAKDLERDAAARQAQHQAEIEAARRTEKAKADTAVAEALKEHAAREVAIKEAAKRDAELALGGELEKTCQLAEERGAEAETAKRRIAELETSTQQIRADLQKSHVAELAQHRELLQRAHDQALIKQGADFSRERESYQVKIKDLDRKLQRKTAHELGDGAELDLLQELRDAFTDDRITPVPSGTAGADIHHEVLYKGEVCGRIVFDSKNRQQWRSSYFTKLRDDQAAADAEHAILSTTVFPGGRKELCIENGVIVANPAQVVALVNLLRNAMLRMHKLRLSAQQRAEKTERLYEYLTSESCAQQFSRWEQLMQDLANIDVEEKKEHDKVWRKRGQMQRSLEKTFQDFSAEVSAIVEA